MDPDQDPAVFVRTFKMPTKNLFKFFCLLLFEGTFNHSSKIKSHKEVTKQCKSRFSYNFCVVMEGSGSSSGSLQIMMDPDPGGPKTYGRKSTVTLRPLLSTTQAVS
jgi:hypothetical protein